MALTAAGAPGGLVLLVCPESPAKACTPPSPTQPPYSLSNYPSGYGAYCPDGVAQLFCADFYTTANTTSTQASDCIIAKCDPCGTTPNPEVYFTTGR